MSRRQHGTNTSDRFHESSIGHPRLSSANARILRTQTSLDSCASNGTSLKRHL